MVSDSPVHTGNRINDRCGVWHWEGFWRNLVQYRNRLPAHRCRVHKVVAIGKASVERLKPAPSMKHLRCGPKDAQHRTVASALERLAPQAASIRREGIYLTSGARVAKKLGILGFKWVQIAGASPLHPGDLALSAQSRGLIMAVLAINPCSCMPSSRRSSGPGGSESVGYTH